MSSSPASPSTDTAATPPRASARNAAIVQSSRVTRPLAMIRTVVPGPRPARHASGDVLQRRKSADDAREVARPLLVLRNRKTLGSSHAKAIHTGGAAPANPRHDVGRRHAHRPRETATGHARP